MRKRFGQSQNRRELFAGVLRYVALGLLTAGGAGIVAKRRRLVREGKCINSGHCTGCEVLERCGLPAALSARETSAGVENDRG
ncbi:MAG: hypothetical protein CEE38_07480 [Planctomycetes bacterium B3_Pla]|nr:MAG: hypothetical protein CEE38_07480 [Planctomycetes bacterium B3_Pla]